MTGIQKQQLEYAKRKVIKWTLRNWNRLVWFIVIGHTLVVGLVALELFGG